MPERIGKYEILERIGREGMGMIFKAHDPLLDRAVAVKVISTDIAATDELRTRFFREAQACARLSHPNIVTVHDMGEDNGRLFIVMEFLEGEQLKHLIEERRALEIEDKLSVMMQVCDGLHYAHQRGIVHRDIKPGNIFLLRNGGVKILDFGAAQIATTGAGLTKTGLTLGSFRYISPEQIQGRPDHRSDVFSVGAVFYEFLSFRPPFTGDNAIRLLEQIRSEQPPPLTDLDPTIPAELTDIVQRAMRKEPSERFPDLEQVRSRIELVLRRLQEEAHQVRARLRAELEQIFHLQATLVERIGALPEDDTLPPIDDRGRLATMQVIERDFEGRIAALKERIARAEALAPAFLRGTELLQTLQFADAALEFEAIIADMPEHARAERGLQQARYQAEEQRRQQVTTELLQDARAALDDGHPGLCLEILAQAKEVSSTAATAQEITSLAETATVALEAQQAARRERDGAERAREEMLQARHDAHDKDAAHYASDWWAEAQAKAAEAQTHFAQGAYVQAAQAFQLATGALRQAADAARAAAVREQVSAER